MCVSNCEISVNSKHVSNIMALEKEFEYFKANQAELFRKYPQKFLVIIEEEVKGAYDTRAEAYDAAVEEFEPGKFMIQQCLLGTDAYTQNFHSRIYI